MTNPVPTTQADDALTSQALSALVRLLARQAARELTDTSAEAAAQPNNSILLLENG